jgi:hypothetical protein
MMCPAAWDASGRLPCLTAFSLGFSSVRWGSGCTPGQPACPLLGRDPQPGPRALELGLPRRPLLVHLVLLELLYAAARAGQHYPPHDLARRRQSHRSPSLARRTATLIPPILGTTRRLTAPARCGGITRAAGKRRGPAGASRWSRCTPARDPAPPARCVLPSLIAPRVQIETANADTGIIARHSETPCTPPSSSQPAPISSSPLCSPGGRTTWPARRPPTAASLPRLPHRTGAGRGSSTVGGSPYGGERPRGA